MYIYIYTPLYPFNLYPSLPPSPSAFLGELPPSSEPLRTVPGPLGWRWPTVVRAPSPGQAESAREA